MRYNEKLIDLAQKCGYDFIVLIPGTHTFLAKRQYLSSKPGEYVRISQEGILILDPFSSGSIERPTHINVGSIEITGPSVVIQVPKAKECHST